MNLFSASSSVMASFRDSLLIVGVLPSLGMASSLADIASLCPSADSYRDSSLSSLLSVEGVFVLVLSLWFWSLLPFSLALFCYNFVLSN